MEKLRWDGYEAHLISFFDQLRRNAELLDVSLYCEGQRILAHKVVLSATSNYFKNILIENPCEHPVIIFQDVKFADLSAVVDFMYTGEVCVESTCLVSFLNTAKLLNLKDFAILNVEAKRKESNVTTCDDVSVLQDDKEPPAVSKQVEEQLEVIEVQPTDKSLGSKPLNIAKKAYKPLHKTEHLKKSAEKRTECSSSADLSTTDMVEELVNSASYKVNAKQCIPEAEKDDSGDSGKELDTCDSSSKRPRTTSHGSGETFEVMVLESDTDEENVDTTSDAPLKSQLRDLKIIKRGNRYSCSFCKRSYSSLSRCRSHCDSHLGKTTCEHCSKVCSSKDAYKQHLKVHTDLFKCQNCGRAFEGLSKLKRHHERHHAENSS